MKKKIIITGASGFLGSHILSKALTENFNVIALINNRKIPDFIKDRNFKQVKCDIRDIDKLQKNLNDCHTVVHTAAKFKNESDIKEINIDATINLFKLASSQNVKQFIFISTRGTIGIEQDVVDSNDHSTNFENHNFIDSYTNSKIIVERKLRNLSTETTTKLLILCPTAIIGPHDDMPTPIGGLIRYFKKNKMVFYLNGYFNLIDVRDIANLCIQSIKNAPISGKYGIGNKNLSMTELIKIIKKNENETYIRIAISPSLIYLFTIIIRKILGKSYLADLIDPYRIKRLKMGFSCFNSKIAKDEIGLKCRNIVETINDTI
tara:strand:+ start:160 stop:1119 length:960 start_codon:yes stop_codon:yes gene_type:complete